MPASGTPGILYDTFPGPGGAVGLRGQTFLHQYDTGLVQRANYKLTDHQASRFIIQGLTLRAS